MVRAYLIAAEYRDRLQEELRRFMRNERGDGNVLSSIMLLAIAALVVIALLAFGRTGMTWLQQKWTEITSG